MTEHFAEFDTEDESGMTVDETKEPPSFKHPLKPLSVGEGELVVFVCHIIGNPPPTVEWYRNEDLASTNADFVVSYDEESGISELVIVECLTEDAGIFKCVASNDIGEAVTSAQLSVTTPLESVTASEVSEAESGAASHHPKSVTQSRNEDTEEDIIQTTTITDVNIAVEEEIVPDIKEKRLVTPEKNEESSDDFPQITITESTEKSMEQEVSEEEVVVILQEDRSVITSCFNEVEEDINMDSESVLEALNSEIQKKDEGHEANAMCVDEVQEGEIIPDMKERRFVTPDHDEELSETLPEIIQTVEESIEDLMEVSVSEEEVVVTLQEDRTPDVQPPQFVRNIYPQVVKECEDACFTLKVNACPMLSLSWYKDNTLLSTSDHIITDMDETTGEVKLCIKNSTPNDVGDYTCVAANPVGQAKCTANLLIVRKYYNNFHEFRFDTYSHHTLDIS